MAGYTPRLELLTKTRPFTSPTSTRHCDSLEYHPGGILQLERDSQILGEMVEGAEGQDAERNIAVHQHRRRRIDGAVTAARHQYLAPVLYRTFDEAADLLATPGDFDPRLAPGLGKDVFQLLGLCGAISVTGGVVEHHRDPAHQADGCWCLRRPAIRSPSATAVTQTTATA